MSELSGELAALATAICWSFTSIFFTIGSTRVGSVAVNRIRLLLALLFLVVTHILTTGSPIPLHAGHERWFWLGLSGIIGLAIGDAMLLQAFVLIGTRISMLLMSLVPIMSTILGWAFLREKLGPAETFAIAITVSGIIWVVLDKRREKNGVAKKQMTLGILLGLGGALGQAVGLLTSKLGLTGDFSPLSGNLIRMLAAASVMWLIAIAMGRGRDTLSRLVDLRARYSILGGTLFGPFIGVWLSLVAIKYARIGVASTLMALPPVLLIPLVHWIFKEKISYQAIAGTVMATVGVAILLLS